MRAIRSLFGAVVVFGLMYATVWTIFGKFEITSAVDDEKITGAEVQVDGEKQCETPCKFRLSPGYHQIQVMKPEGFNTSETSETIHVFTIALGRKVEASFVSQ